MPNTSEVIPLLAQIHLRAREQREELWQLALEAYRAGGAPASIARVLGLSEAEVDHLEHALNAAVDDPSAAASAVGRWPLPSIPAS